MARGLPDDSNIVKVGAVYALQDMAELAARLGSPVNYIRFGDVYMMDEFDNGLGSWGQSIRGDDGFIQLTPDHWRSKGVCAQLNTGKGDNPDTAIWRRLPIPDSRRMGFGFAFAFENAAIDIQLQLVITKDEFYHHFHIKIEVAANKFYYLDYLGDWIEFDDTPIGGFQWLFHLCKLTVDLSTMRYNRFYFNDRSYDLSTISCQNTPAVGQVDYCECKILGTGVAMASGDFYVDDAVTTQNEV